MSCIQNGEWLMNTEIVGKEQVELIRKVTNLAQAGKAPILENTETVVAQ